MIKNYSTYIKEQISEDQRSKFPEFKLKDVVYCEKEKVFGRVREITKNGLGEMLYRVRFTDHKGTEKWITWNNLKKAIRVNGVWKIAELESEKVPKIKTKEGIKWYSGGKLSELEEIDIGEPSYDDFITDDEFRNFLIDKDCYDSYIKNVLKLKSAFAKNFGKYRRTNRRELLNNCFYWSDTPEGSYYWSNLSDEWKDHVDNVKNWW